MASGIIEKGNDGLFNNEVEVNGKYSFYIRYLKEEIGLFPTYREAYVISAAVGLYFNKHETDDNGEKMQPASIFAADLSRRKGDLRFIYRIMMLVQDDPSMSIEDYMNRAFRDDPELEGNADMIKNNMKVFNSYACGGLEYLYNLFESQDTIEKRVDTLYDLIHGVALDEDFVEEEELPDFSPL